MAPQTAVKPSPRPRAEPAEEPEERPQETVGGKALLRPKVLTALVLVVLVAGGAVFAWLHFDRIARLDDLRSSAVDAGKRYATSIATYDYRNATANLDQVAAQSTEKFATEYRNSSAQLMQLITQYQATSQGTILDAAVSEADETHAVVLAFVDQTIKNTNLKDPRIDRSRMKLALVRAGDDWRLDQITLL